MGHGQPLACAAVLQPVQISCHIRGCKALLSSIVSGTISSELPLLFYLWVWLNTLSVSLSYTMSTSTTVL